MKNSHLPASPQPSHSLFSGEELQTVSSINLAETKSSPSPTNTNTTTTTTQQLEPQHKQMHKQCSENNLLTTLNNSRSTTTTNHHHVGGDDDDEQEESNNNNRRNTINILPTHFVHKRGSQELPELVSPYRKIATTNNLKSAALTLLNNRNSQKQKQKQKQQKHSFTNNNDESSPTTLQREQYGEEFIVGNESPPSSFAKYKYALENDDFSQIDFGMDVNSAQTSASEITFPVPNKANAFYGNAQNSGNGNFFFNGQYNTASVDETMMRKNSVIDDSVSDNGELEITKHYELYLICIGDLDNCLVHKMLKTIGGQMYISNRQVSFILRNTNEKVTFNFNFYSQFNWYLMDFLKDEAKDCHGLLFMFNITHSEGWSELKQTISKKYVDVQDFVRPSIVLGTYSHSNRMPSVVNTSQVINVVDKWKEKQIITYLEIDVEDKDECKMALTHLATSIIQNIKDKQKDPSQKSNGHGHPIFSKICGSVSGD